MLPRGYDDAANAERRYPALYLLHGEGNSFLAWREILDGAAAAGEREMILVMPDAGESFYVNWARTDDGRRDAWEDYLVDDVVGHVDARYRTVAAREGRAVAGFGMGGYGALTVGLRNADRFVSVGSQSGRRSTTPGWPRSGSGSAAKPTRRAATRRRPRRAGAPRTRGSASPVSAASSTGRRAASRSSPRPRRRPTTRSCS